MPFGAKPMGGSVPKSFSLFKQRTIYKDLTVQWWFIGHHAGTSFMLARFEQSSLKEIAAAANRFELNGIDIKGVIFNAVEKNASSYYGDYGYYNYEYKS